MASTEVIDKTEPSSNELELGSEGSQSQKVPLKRKILTVLWDSLDKSPEERKLVAKIDWMILSYACLAYFIKSLDQTNVTNAYVSGMKGDLSMHGNEYNLLTTYFNIGYILGQIPSQMVLTAVRPSIWLPTLQLLWGFTVMGMAGAKNIETLYALRFVTGLLEASAYPGIMTLLGSWYTPQELGKRSGIFQISSSAANLFSGYLQAGLYSGMNGRSGLAAWRWLFIFDGIIGLPIAIYGYWAIPDSPSNTRNKWFKPEEKQLAIDRMDNCGRAPRRKLTLKTMIEIMTSWPVYLFSVIFICHVLGIRIYAYFNIWLKSTGLWSTEQVNEIPSAGYALQIIFTMCYAWTSDALGKRCEVIMFAGMVATIGCIILSVWPSDNIPAMLAGWFLTYCETGMGIITIAWINETCSHSAEHRGVIIGIVEAMSFTFQAWVPLLIYKDSPHFHIGYEMAAMFFALEIVLAPVIWFMAKRWPQKPRE